MGRRCRSDRAGKTRTSPLEIRTALLEMRMAPLEMCKALQETATAKSMRVNDKNILCLERRSCMFTSTSTRTESHETNNMVYTVNNQGNELALPRH